MSSFFLIILRDIVFQRYGKICNNSHKSEKIHLLNLTVFTPVKHMTFTKYIVHNAIFSKKQYFVIFKIKF